MERRENSRYFGVRLATVARYQLKGLKRLNAHILMWYCTAESVNEMQNNGMCKNNSIRKKA